MQEINTAPDTVPTRPLQIVPAPAPYTLKEGGTKRVRLPVIGAATCILQEGGPTRPQPPIRIVPAQAAAELEAPPDTVAPDPPNEPTESSAPAPKKASRTKTQSTIT